MCAVNATAHVNAHETIATRRGCAAERGNPLSLGGVGEGAERGRQSRSGLVGATHVNYFVVVGIVAFVCDFP